MKVWSAYGGVVDVPPPKPERLVSDSCCQCGSPDISSSIVSGLLTIRAVRISCDDCGFTIIDEVF